MAVAQSGQIDCLPTTFDWIALDDPGIITTFINKSAGGDQIWARERAEAIAGFIVQLGVKKERLFITWTLPPESHWETLDLLKQMDDRYEELSLLVSRL